MPLMPRQSRLIHGRSAQLKAGEAQACLSEASLPVRCFERALQGTPKGPCIQRCRFLGTFGQDQKCPAQESGTGRYVSL